MSSYTPIHNTDISNNGLKQKKWLYCHLFNKNCGFKKNSGCKSMRTPSNNRICTSFHGNNLNQTVSVVTYQSLTSTLGDCCPLFLAERSQLGVWMSVWHELPTSGPITTFQWDLGQDFDWANPEHESSSAAIPWSIFCQALTSQWMASGYVPGFSGLCGVVQVLRMKSKPRS